MKYFIILFSIFAILSVACADILHVPSQYSTIQAAVDSVSSGDTIKVAPGIYGAVHAVGLTNVVFIGSGFLEPNKTVVNGNNNVRGFLLENSDSVKICGFEIGYCWQECVNLRFCTNSIIADNYIHDCNDNLGNGLNILSCENIIIKRNIIAHNIEHGLYIDHPYHPEYYSRNIEVLNNTIVETGIGTWGGSGVVQTWSDTGFVFMNNITAFHSDYGLWYKFGSRSTTSVISFNDNFGNLMAPWGRCLPDIGNIYADPLFVGGTGAEQYQLQANSPCIDAGCPLGPRDPDSTIADIGAFYFHQVVNGVTVNIIPFHSPIILTPGQGCGWFKYWIDVINNAGNYQFTDIWIEAILPDSTTHHEIRVWDNINIPAGTYTYLFHQLVPPSAPAGEYTFMISAGEYPNTVNSSDYFTFTKVSTDENNSSALNSWICNGDFGDFIDSSVRINISNDYNLSCSPNPFNSSTQIQFQLPHSGMTTVRVYNISGREVASLMNGYLQEGAHSVNWNAGGLSSGIYFVEINHPVGRQIQRVLYLK